MKVKELINKLSKLSDDLKDKDVCIVAQNGLLLEPKVRYNLVNKYDILNYKPENVDKIVLTWGV